MTVELTRDALREHGWWLLVGGSEQSYVDVSDPMHLEFEYVQMIAGVLDSMFPTDAPVTALHLGGGLCTLPRWIAARHPGSAQRVAERSAQIADLSRSLGEIPGVTVVIDDALAVATGSRRESADLVVCDVYDGPETVTQMFTIGSVRLVHDLLRPDGVYVCNLSDATPFALSRVVTATLQAVFGSVVLLAEPSVLRGRRSGNLVLAAADREVATDELSRRASGGLVKFRMMADSALTDFVADAQPAGSESDLPPSGESISA
jgi:spermidine synthase